MRPGMTGGGAVGPGNTAFTICQVSAVTTPTFGGLIMFQCLTICGTVANQPIGRVGAVNSGAGRIAVCGTAAEQGSTDDNHAYTFYHGEP